MQVHKLLVVRRLVHARQVERRHLRVVVAHVLALQRELSQAAELQRDHLARVGHRRVGQDVCGCDGGSSRRRARLVGSHFARLAQRLAQVKVLVWRLDQPSCLWRQLREMSSISGRTRTRLVHGIKVHAAGQAVLLGLDQMHDLWRVMPVPASRLSRASPIEASGTPRRCSLPLSALGSQWRNGQPAATVAQRQNSSLKHKPCASPVLGALDVMMRTQLYAS